MANNLVFVDDVFYNIVLYLCLSDTKPPICLPIGGGCGLSRKRWIGIYKWRNRVSLAKKVIDSDKCPMLSWHGK